MPTIISVTNVKRLDNVPLLSLLRFLVTHLQKVVLTIKAEHSQTPFLPMGHTRTSSFFVIPFKELADIQSAFTTEYEILVDKSGLFSHLH